MLRQLPVWDHVEALRSTKLAEQEVHLRRNMARNSLKMSEKAVRNP